MRVIHDLDVSMPGTVGLVPTMGALHDGHGSLIARAREENDAVIVSVFVNPLQFNDVGDYRNYPRTLEADLKVAERYGADVVFAPSLETMYPGGDPEISVSTGAMGRVLEGAYRPGHFDGVATVVAKLFNILRPQRAYFGQKDAQQLAIIRRMVADLNVGVEVVAADLVRAADGLAESSRNTRLSARERRHALALPRALAALADGAELGPTCERLAAAEGVELDYLVVVDPATFSPTEHRPALALGAIHVGPVRLIDNRAV